jgi:hypothetical protein
MTNLNRFIQANKDVKMNGLWIYALTPKGREFFDRADIDTKQQILLALVVNGNISASTCIQIQKHLTNQN